MPTSPPVPPAVMAWERAKLVALMWLRSPVRRPRWWLSSTSQESSTTASPWASATACSLSQSGQLPHRLGTRIALVRGPIMSSTASASIW